MLAVVHGKHLSLSSLVFVAVAAIIGDLAVAFFNTAEHAAPVWLQWLSGALTVVSLLGAAAFVVSVVNPDGTRYQ